MQNGFLKRIKPYLDKYEPLKPIATGVSPEIDQPLNIKGIAFDIYGTLIISSSGDLDKSTITVENLVIALNQAGIKLINNEKGENILHCFHNEVINQQKILMDQGHPYPEVDIILVWQACIDKATSNHWITTSGFTDIKTLCVVFEILSNQVWPMPYMGKVLETLRTKNIPLGIVSNAQFYTPIIMNKFISGKLTGNEFIDGFNPDISVFSYKLLRSKPDRQLFEILAKNFKENYNLNPNEVLFIGNDMLKDVWTANQLGFKTALFAGDKRSLRLRENDERCINLKPDFVLTGLDQVLSLIKQ